MVFLERRFLVSVLLLCSCFLPNRNGSVDSSWLMRASGFSVPVNPLTGPVTRRTGRSSLLAHGSNTRTGPVTFEYVRSL